LNFKTGGFYTFTFIPCCVNLPAGLEI
jgi:hypothetical protein